MNATLRLRALAIIAALSAVHCGSDDPASPGGFTGTGGLGQLTGGAPGGGAVPQSTGGQPGSSGGSLGSTGGSLGSTGGVASGGASTSGGTAGTQATGGAGNGGASTGGSKTYTVDPVGNETRAPGFVNLAPPMGQPLPAQGAAVTPTPPAGWNYYPIDGAVCRDGSPAGLYVHRGTVDRLLVFLEGGGACSNNHFCQFNPKSVDTVLSGDGETVLGSAAGSGPGRQQPGVYTDPSHTGAPMGVFETERADNPFKGWSQVYIPYCTGDVFFGTKKDASVPESTEKMQFVGYLNMQKFMGRIVPTFQGKVTKVVIAGSSAGGFGSVLNYSMVQDSFGNVPVSILDDSGPPFEDQQMPVCMQKRWREAWGFENSLPPDCAGCRRADGGGILRYADFVIKKHPKAKLAIISSMDDEVIRLFYSVGLNECAKYDSADPYMITVGQLDPNNYYQAQPYEDGLKGIRTVYAQSGRLATYYMTGQKHQHLFRSRFYEAPVSGTTIAKFTQDFIDDKLAQVGP